MVVGLEPTKSCTCQLATGLSKNDVSPSKKMHIVKVKTEGNEKEIGVRWCWAPIDVQRERGTCKTSLIGGGSDEDPPMLKSVNGLRRKSDKVSGFCILHT